MATKPNKYHLNDPFKFYSAIQHFLYLAWEDFNRKYGSIHSVARGWYPKGVKLGIHHFRFILEHSDETQLGFLKALKSLSKDDFSEVLCEGTERSIETLLSIKDYLVLCLEQSKQPKYTEFKEIYHII